MLGSNTWIIKSSRNAVSLCHLTVFVLHQVTLHAVDNSRLTTTHCCTACRLHTDEASRSIDEARENSHRIRAATDTCNNEVWIGAEQIIALHACLVTNHAVELANHVRVRVRPHDRTEAIVRALNGGHPVAHRLIDCIFQCLATRGHRFNI